MQARSPLKAAMNARSSVQEDARKQEALAVPMTKAKSMWKAALDAVTHPFLEEDLSTLTQGVKRLGAPGPIEDTFVVDLETLVDDPQFENKLKNLVKTLKAGRKKGILSFTGSVTLLPGAASAVTNASASKNAAGPYPVYIQDHDNEADILAKERLERSKSVAMVVQMQEEERERRLQEMDKAEKHTELARRATIEEAKEALEEEQKRRMDEQHPHEKPVQKLVRQHTKSKVNMAMELERERRIAEKSTGFTPPKINLGNVPVIN